MLLSPSPLPPSFDTAGEIMLDGNKLKDINIKWLRQQIGIVSQEPVLFNMSEYSSKRSICRHIRNLNLILVCLYLE